MSEITVVSKGKNLENREIFLITFPDGSRVECTETYRYNNRFDKVVQARMRHSKIDVIKEIRTQLGLGFKDSKDLVEALWQ